MNLAELLDLTYRLHWSGSKETSYPCGLAIVQALGSSTPVHRVEPLKAVLAFKAQGNSGATINRKMSALGKMLSVAVEAGAIKARPKLPRMKEAGHRTRYLTHQEEASLFQHLDHTLQAFATFLVETGLRVGEAQSLVWSSISDGKVHVKTSKGGAPRSIPLTARASKALSEVRYREYPWRGLSLTWSWNKAKVLAGLDEKEVVPHCLRHTCASRLVQAGVDIITVQKWMGHSSLAMTQRYAHLAPDALSKGVLGLEQLREQDAS